MMLKTTVTILEFKFNSSRCDVRGDEDPNLAGLEVKKGLLTVRLLAVTVDALTVDACNHQTQFLQNILYLHLIF